MNRDSRRVFFLVALVAFICFESAVPAQAPSDPQFELMWGTFGMGGGQFDGPEALDISSTGEVFVADTNNHRVQVFNLDGEFVRSWGSFCDIEEVETCDNPEGNGQFYAPEGIAIDSEREIVYVVDSSNARIQVFDLEGNFIQKWGSAGTSEGQFSLPIGAEVDNDGNLYVTDLLNDRIQVFASDGTFLRTWGVSGSEAGNLRFPVDIAIVGSNLYVTENVNHRVQQFDLEGNAIRMWGSACDLATNEGCDSQNGDGQFFRPFGIAADSDGNIYVVDQSNHRIQSFTSDGEFIAQFGSVCALFGADNVPAGTGCQREGGEGQFFLPKGIAISPDGEIIIADSDNHRIQVFQ